MTPRKNTNEKAVSNSIKMQFGALQAKFLPSTCVGQVVPPPPAPVALLKPTHDGSVNGVRALNRSERHPARRGERLRSRAQLVAKKGASGRMQRPTELVRSIPIPIWSVKAL